MAKKKPRILLCNDDGINAPGLAALYEGMKSIGDVVVVAPDSEKSAVGHAITLSDPLRVWDFKKNDECFGYAVNGTPADCVKLACRVLLEKKPDLVVSGINLGSNTGINAIYSGTVSAATEGAILGISSFAISLATMANPDFTYAAEFARKLSTLILNKGLPKGTLLNVNVPAVQREHIKETVITYQGKAIFQEHYEKRIDPFDRVYYWMTSSKGQIEKDKNVDDRAILDNKISITPLHYELTNYDFMKELKSWEI